MDVSQAIHRAVGARARTDVASRRAASDSSSGAALVETALVSPERLLAQLTLTLRGVSWGRWMGGIRGHMLTSR